MRTQTRVFLVGICALAVSTAQAQLFGGPAPNINIVLSNTQASPNQPISISLVNQNGTNYFLMNGVVSGYWKSSQQFFGQVNYNLYLKKDNPPGEKTCLSFTYFPFGNGGASTAVVEGQPLPVPQPCIGGSTGSKIAGYFIDQNNRKVPTKINFAPVAGQIIGVSLATEG